MKTMPDKDFAAHCLDVMRQVRETGEPVIVLRAGEPLAEIVPPPRVRRRRSILGSMAGTGRIVGDIVAPIADAASWEALQDCDCPHAVSVRVREAVRARCRHRA